MRIRIDGYEAPVELPGFIPVAGSPPLARPEPVRVPDGDGTADIRALDGPLFLAHVVGEGGTHYCKLLGGKFKKHGISVWPEVLGAANIKGWVEWPVALNKRDGLEGERRALPAEMTAFVQFDGEKPVKVVELR